MDVDGVADATIRQLKDQLREYQERGRLPDPTLDKIGEVFVKLEGLGPRPVAHLWAEDLGPGEYLLACGMQAAFLPQLPANHACWFAVACRKCFLNAPPHGTRWLSQAHGTWKTDPGLSWQLPREGGVTHRCPPDGEGVMPCCGRTPLEVSRSDRMTRDDGLVTCLVDRRDG